MKTPVPGAATTNFGFADAGPEASSRVLTHIAAISEALREEMRRNPDVLLVGEDIAGDFGGAFKVTKGFEAEFSSRRVLNTPIAELGFTGMASGMALMGLRPVVEMQFADFISSAFDSIVQFVATAHYRWGGAVPWVVRAPSDGGIRSGPFHSQNPEAWFVHTPGLKVVTPGTPADAKGLLIAAIRDDNVGAELSAIIADQAFDWLDGPVKRLGGLDTPVPFSPPLEDAYRPTDGNAAPTVQGRDISQVDAIVREAMDRQRIPGLAVAVLKGDRARQSTQRGSAGHRQPAGHHDRPGPGATAGADHTTGWRGPERYDLRLAGDREDAAW